MRQLTRDGVVAVLVCVGLVLAACGTETSDSGGPPAYPSSGSTPTASLAEVPSRPTELSNGAGADSLEQGARPPSSNVDPNGYTYTVEEYLNWAMKDLDTKWSPWFVSRGYTEPYVRYDVIMPGQSETSVCHGVLTDHTLNAYYCGRDAGGDGMIWLPATTFQQMWTGKIFTSKSQRVGDFAAAIITAHEFGHHVADELSSQSTQAGRSITPFTGANSELIADCFAGVWAATAYYDGVLEPGDFDEAAAALESIGDPATPVSNPHGSSAERVAALKVGYNDRADPTPCVLTYWK